MIVEHGKKEIKNDKAGVMAVEHNTKSKVNRDRNARLRKKNRKNPKLTQPGTAPASKPPPPVAKTVKAKRKAIKARKASVSTASTIQQTTEQNAPVSQVVRSNNSAPHVIPTPISRKPKPQETYSVQKTKFVKRPLRTVTHTPPQAFSEETVTTEEVIQPEENTEQKQPVVTTVKRTKKKNRFDNPLATKKTVNSEDEEVSVISHASMKRSEYKKPVRPKVAATETIEPIFEHPAFDDPKPVDAEEETVVEKQKEVVKVEKPVEEKKPKKEHTVISAPITEVEEEVVVEEETPEPDPVVINTLEDLESFFEGNISDIIDGILNDIVDFEALPININIDGINIIDGVEGFAKATDKTPFTLQTKKPKALAYLIDNILTNTKNKGIGSDKIIPMMIDMVEMCGSLDEWIKLLDELYKEIIKQAK